MKKNKSQKTIKIILASGSPRRRALFALFNMPFEAISSDFVENMDLPILPENLVKLLALGKAEAVSNKHPKAIVIAADTFVLLGKDRLGKPKSETDAINMLKKISGQGVDILTAVAVMRKSPKKIIQTLQKTKVHFRKFNKEKILNYVRTGEPMDKAGAFAVQGLGAILIDRIEGEFTGAMGLPLRAVSEALNKFGIKFI